MIRKVLFGFAAATIVGMGIGCEAAKDTAKGAADKAKDGAAAAVDKTKEAGKGVADAAKGAADKAKEGAGAMADKAKEAGTAVADKATEAAKAAVLKPIEEGMKAVTDKIGTLKDAEKSTATGLLDGIKKLIEEFKAAPADKFKAIGETLATKFAELKKSIGL